MKVHIENKLYLESDAMQFILKEYTGKTDKDGNETFKVHGYHSNIKFALNNFLKMKIKQTTATTLKELVEDVERIEKYIESKLDI